MKLPLLLVFMVSISIANRAANTAYAFSNIPAALLDNANAVKRMEFIRFEVVSLDKARYYRKVAYTILNEKGQPFADCLEYNDDFQSVESIEGNLYNGLGEKIKSLRKKDIQDNNSNDNINLADDFRIKHHNFHCRLYPYTVEYEVQLTSNSTMFYPDWIAQEAACLSIESATIEIVLPEAFTLRYKTFNIKTAPLISSLSNSKKYTWELKNINAVTYEIASPDWNEITPTIFFSPEKFAVSGYQGNMSTWKELGKFTYSLIQGRDQLPEDIKKRVHELTDNVPDTLNRISLLYDFLQTTCRYVSIQKGIGGWQPSTAQFVAVNKYGDCKALSNYLRSLLKEAGIPSDYMLVKAGDNMKFFMSDFPSTQFNHVIISVPLQHDTVWLECTSQTLPMGYLSGLTSGRRALVVKEDGSALVETPEYKETDNLKLRKLKGVLVDGGNLNMDMAAFYHARREDALHLLVNNITKEKVMDYLKAVDSLADFSIVHYDYKEQRSALPYVIEKLQLNFKNYATVTNKRIFINPYILSQPHEKLSPDKNRKFAIQLGFSYTDKDTIEIRIPPGYKIESFPKSVDIHTKFGNFQSTVLFSNDTITYYRTLEQFSGRFPSALFEELVTFFEQVNSSDRSKVVLVKEEAN